MAADYRLSVAQNVATREKSDQIGAPLEQNLTRETIHVLADVFTRMAGLARDSGVITDAELVTLRTEIGMRLRVGKPSKFTYLETELGRCLARFSGPASAGMLSTASNLARTTVNSVLHGLRQKLAVNVEYRKNVGYYTLTESAAEFREAATVLRIGAGALLQTPIVSSSKSYRAPTLVRKER